MSDNELIAEFMGFKFLAEDLYSHDTKVKQYLNTHGYYEDSKMWKPSDFIYDKSWDWLMPVVEKIESLGFNFWIGKYASSVTKIGSDEPSFTVRDKDKLKVVYQVGVEFIKWYNENGKEKT